MPVSGYHGHGFSLFLGTDEVNIDVKTEMKATSAHINNRGNFYEIIYFIEGQTSYFIEGDYHLLEPSDIVFSNATEIHGIVHRHSCRYKRLVIKLEPKFFKINNIESIQKTFDNKYPGDGNYISCRTPLGKALNSKIETLNQYLETSGISAMLINDALVSMVKLLENSVTRLEDDVSSNIVLRKIVEYITENAHSDIGLKSIAEKFYIDRSHLARIFKQLTNCSINEYITLLRFEHIKQLRRYSNLTLAEAVKAVGYKNYSTFYRAYKKHFGVAPAKNDPLPFGEYIDFKANH